MALKNLKPIAHAQDLFKGLISEDSQSEDKQIVIKGSTLKNIINNFDYLIDEFDHMDYEHSEDLAYKIKIGAEFLAPRFCSSSDIHAFSKILGNYPEKKIKFKNSASYFVNLMQLTSGIYLSSLINKSPEEIFHIDTTRSNILPDSLGYKNYKKIIVNGNLGNFLGHKMKDGEITVNGKVGFEFGNQMQGGALYIDDFNHPINPNIITGCKGKIYLKGKLYYDQSQGGRVK